MNVTHCVAVLFLLVLQKIIKIFEGSVCLGLIVCYIPIHVILFFELGAKVLVE